MLVRIKHNHFLVVLKSAFFLFAILLSACHPTKKINPNQHLLVKTKILNNNSKIDNNEIANYIKQKPNKKILLSIEFHLWLYNLANENKIKQRRQKVNKKHAAKNAKRVSKGKKEKKYDRQLTGEWLLSIGEAPVVYDSALSKKTTKQIHTFLKNKGYFLNYVSDSVYYKKRKKAEVFYSINVSKPYTINKLEYSIPDELLKYYFFSDTSKTLIKKGNNYDVDILQQERDRISRQLNNLGYFFFTKDYIYYEIDTSIGDRKVDITLGIKKFAHKDSINTDSIIEINHSRFYIKNVYINLNSKDKNIALKDTLIADSTFFVFSTELNYKTKVLLSSIFIHKRDLYQVKSTEATYKRLSELKAFKSININFYKKSNDSLDCYIFLSPVLKQSFLVETEGTSTQGNLGISGSFTYQNKNLFKGAEIFEFRMKGGIQAQRPLESSENQNLSFSNATQQFNTIEFGPEINIYIPRFLLPFKVPQSKNSNPKTIFTGALTYQSRLVYKRTVSNLSLGYTWKETSSKTHTISPFVINFVKVDLAQDFLNYLNEKVKNLYLINSFSDHFTTSSRYTFNYNEQKINKSDNFSFFKFSAESSGNILRGVYNLANDIKPNTFKKDQYGRYELLDIVYSQYVRFDSDFRYYLNKNELNKIVFRIAAGIGKPFINFPELPFERSFFSGGSNGIRAWQSRTLGPGSYSDDGTFSFDQFGDGQLEANIEYRFNLLKKLNGALFVDAGNTWLRRPEVTRPGGEFDLNRFYKEIAVGSGIGFRADFGFFIIRFDTGIKTHDPQFKTGDRWIIKNIFNPEWKRIYKLEHNNSKYNFLTFNLGIGYPF